jgi:hypothetical protein
MSEDISSFALFVVASPQRRFGVPSLDSHKAKLPGHRFWVNLHVPFCIGYDMTDLISL